MLTCGLSPASKTRMDGKQNLIVARYIFDIQVLTFEKECPVQYQSMTLDDFDTQGTHPRRVVEEHTMILVIHAYMLLRPERDYAEMRGCQLAATPGWHGGALALQTEEGAVVSLTPTTTSSKQQATRRGNQFLVQSLICLNRCWLHDADSNLKDSSIQLK